MTKILGLLLTGKKYFKNNNAKYIKFNGDLIPSMNRKFITKK